MVKTGRGYHRRSLRHTGKGDDRRENKKQTTKLQRAALAFVQ